jgi:orotate phosphoribosyltransferase
VVGEVTLSSGARAEYYVDAKRAILRPGVFTALGTLLLSRARELDANAVGGVPMSAIPVACAALAASAGGGGPLEKAFIVRKEPKLHGLRRVLEGPPLHPADRCLIVEDVVTSGGSTVSVLERMQEERLTVAGVVSVLDRLAGGRAAIEAATDAPYAALTTIDDIYPDR